MKLRDVLLILSVLFTATLLSCSDDNEAPVAGDKVKANFTAGISASTRVGDVIWDINDAIGIVMLHHDSREIVEEVYNLRYYTTTPAGNFVPTTPDNIIYFPQSGSEVTFKAYYPFLSGLQRNLMIPVTVTDQSNLSAIDFMTADHMTGFSKSDPNVSLEFHHRLSKVIFKLTIADDVQGVLPEDINLAIQGMYTHGTYDLMNEQLNVDNTSMADISLPLRGVDNERTGIVLPRPAGSGATFDLTTANGSHFAAEMDPGLALEPGYKYVFNVTIEGTEVNVSVTVEDWVEGPTTSYDMLGITTPVGDSYGVNPGDQMNVYIQNGNAFEALRTYTYGTDGRWTTPSPVYWDEIQHDPINLRAALVPAAPANDTQLPDILVATPLSVERNHGAEFVFTHAGSRVVVELQSNIFTPAELDAATITLPSYFIGGREELGLFIPGITRGNILVDRTNPADQYAIIQPQAVSPDAPLVTVRIGDKDYTARTTSDGFLYEAGVAYKLIVTVNESDVSVSATVIDWLPTEPEVFEILEVTAPVGSTSGVDVGARMTVYKKNGDLYDPWTTFTYVGNDQWNPDTEVYWKDVPEPNVDLRASIVAAPALNSAQMEDLLVADDVNVTTGSGADFTLRHAAAKITATLISDIFSVAELNAATITLPHYVGGGTLENGQFSPGQALRDIPLFTDAAAPPAQNGVYYSIGLIQPQTIQAGDNLFRVTIGGRDFWAKAPANGFTYAGGVNYAVVIHLNDDALSVSATVIDWTEETIELNAFTVGAALPGPSSGVENGDQMQVYTSDETTRELLSTFTYNLAADSWTSSPTIFWESIPNITNFYAGIFKAPKLNDTQLDDYLIATPLVGDPIAMQPLNFQLRHPAAKVMIQLRSSDGTFSNAELANMQLTLPNYLIGGEYNNGTFTFPTPAPTGTVNVEIVDNTAVAIIRPQEALAGRVLVNVNNPTTNRDYPVTSQNNISFDAGKVTTLIIDMRKTEVGISATAVDWEAGANIQLVAPTLTISGSLGNTSDFFRGKSIHAYILGNDFRDVTYTYTETPPGSGTYNWTTNQILYWDDLRGRTANVTGVYYPNGAAPSLNSGVTTFVWNLPNNQSTGYDNYDLLMYNLSVSSPTYVNFDFRHVLSRVRIKIVSDEFTLDELRGANITLNNFVIKGSASLTTATATGGNTPESLTPYTDIDGQEYSALVMPQNFLAGSNIASIGLRDYPGETFPANLTTNLSFVAGKETVITITLRKTRVDISATLENWTTGSTGGIIIQ